MADSHCGMPLQQQAGYRPADDLTAADYARVRAGNFDLVAIQQLNDSRWSAWNESGTTHCQQTYVRRVEGIHVLRWIDCFKNRGLVNLFWQRQLNQDAVDVFMLIQPGDDSKQVSGVRRH